MTIADIKKTTDTKMEQSIAALKNNLAKVRTGRANPALLDTIHVDYYGSQVPLSQVANVSLLDARTISVQPWEKNMSAKIEKAIRESDLGLNPASLGDLIRVPMPPMSGWARPCKGAPFSWPISSSVKDALVLMSITPEKQCTWYADRASDNVINGQHLTKFSHPCTTPVRLVVAIYI